MRARGLLFVAAAVASAYAALLWAGVVPTPTFLGGSPADEDLLEDAPDLLEGEPIESGPLALASRPRAVEALGTAEADAEAAARAAKVEAPVALDGIVRRADGRPAVGARVTVIGADGHSVTALTNEEGAFHFDLLRGLYDLVVRGGFDGAIYRHGVPVDGRALEPLELGAAADVNLAVASAGRGVPGASVRAWLAVDGGGTVVAAEGMTEGDGSFRADAIPLGAYTFEIAVAEGLTLLRRAQVTGDLSLSIEIPPPARLHGRVTDALSHLPVAARVVLTLTLGDGLTVEVTGASGADGVYSLEVPRGGAKGFAIESPEHAPFPSSAETRSVQKRLQALRNQDALLLDAALQPGARVRGLVVDTATKEPVPGLTLRFLQDRSPVARSVETGADGRYEVRGLGQGSWRASIESPGWYPGPKTPSIQLAAPGPDGAPAEGTLDLEVWSAGRISGVVVTAGDTPASGARVWLFGGGGVVRGARQAGRALETTTSADGSFSLDDVPPNVKLSVRAALGGTEAVPVGPYRLLDAPVPPIRLVLAPTARLHGRVTDLFTRDPIAGAAVVADPVGAPAGRGRRSVTTNAQGTYDLVALLAGGWKVTCSRKGLYLPSEPRALEVSGEVPDLPLDLVLDPGLAVAGVVVDESNRPVAGARVVLSGAEDSANPPATVWRNATTDAQGAFRLTGLRSGRFSLLVRKSGFQSARLDLRGGEDRLRVLLSPPPPPAGN